MPILRLFPRRLAADPAGAVMIRLETAGTRIAEGQMTTKKLRARRSRIIHQLCALSRDGWRNAKTADYWPLEAELRDIAAELHRRKRNSDGKEDATGAPTRGAYQVHRRIRPCPT